MVLDIAKTQAEKVTLAKASIGLLGLKSVLIGNGVRYESKRYGYETG